MKSGTLLYQVIGATFFRDKIAAEFKDIEGFLTSDEGYALFLAALYGPGSGAIVEIGSFMGRSTCFLAAGSKHGDREKVIAIDHFRGSPEHQAGGDYEVAEIVQTGSTYRRFQENLKRAGLADQVEAIRASTELAAADWNRPIRLLFIDGDHDYAATKRDFDLFSARVVPQGIVCFHDVGTWPGVTQFCEELARVGWHETFRVQTLAAYARD